MSTGKNSEHLPKQEKIFTAVVELTGSTEAGHSASWAVEELDVKCTTFQKILRKII